jgi:hypothetical protein
VNAPADAIFMSVHIPASADLASVNASVKRYEETIGPLAAMKVDNDMTLLKFDATSPSPTSIANIAKQVDGKPDIPDGATLVTTGQIFLQGTQTLCAATRAS